MTSHHQTNQDSHTESVLYQHQAAIDSVLATQTPVWIFAGDQGIGKATAALHAAARLLAETGAAGEGGESLFIPPAGATTGYADDEAGTTQGEGEAQDSLFATPETSPPDTPTPPAALSTAPPPTSQPGTPSAASISLSQLAIHPDAMLIRPPQNGSPGGTSTGGAVVRIGIEQIRAMSAFLPKTTVRGGWRVVVVDALDDMTLNAANGMLKMLEEPPAKTTIILISHTPGAILPTIRSRCRVKRFMRLSDDDCRAVLSRLYPDIDKSHAEIMLAFADGSPGRAVLMVETKCVELYTDTCAALASDTPDWMQLDQLASTWGAGGGGNRRRRRLGLLLFDRLLTLAAKGEKGRSVNETAALTQLQSRHSPVYLAGRHSQMLADLRQADGLNTATQPVFLRLMADLTATTSRL